MEARSPGTEADHSAAPSLGETIATFPGEVVVGFLLSAYDSLVSLWDLSPFKYGLISLTDGPQAGVGAAAVKAIEFINAYHQAERDPGGAALAVLGNAFAADQWGTNSGQALGRSIFTVATLATGAGGALKGISALKATAAAAKTATGSIKAPPFGAASVTGEVGQVLSRTDLNPAQFSNFSRYVRKLPAAAEPTVITRGPDGSVHLSTKVPGRVPGSYATYDKVVDGSGATIGYTKTTVDPNGSVVHVKDKFP